jgi:hypothetical protein
MAKCSPWPSRNHVRAPPGGIGRPSRRARDAPARIDPVEIQTPPGPGGWDCPDDRITSDGVCVPTGTAELYVPAGVSPPPFSFPPPPTTVFPSPTPRSTPLSPAGPVPPNARTWKVTVDNTSSEPATLFVAEEDGGGTLRLVGSASPNVVPAGTSVKVTFLLPAKGGPDDGWIYVNPRPGEGGSLVSAADIGIPGKILIRAEGDGGWLSP